MEKYETIHGLKSADLTVEKRIKQGVYQVWIESPMGEKRALKRFCSDRSASRYFNQLVRFLSAIADLI